MEIPAEEAPTLTSDHPLTPRQRRQAILAATLGNGLEFYDFITFAFFAIQIGHTFFPSQSAFLSLMGSLATFFAVQAKALEAAQTGAENGNATIDRRRAGDRRKAGDKRKAG